jgi:NAD(P)-dependent dehydrogenase (short-subunit alcohol dehydrogenase family)
VILVSRTATDRRGCAPDEVGAMIAFLASERCSYNSGSVVTIDAGLSGRTFNF